MSSGALNSTHSLTRQQSVRQLVAHEIKRAVANRKLTDLTAEAAVAHCRSRPYLYSYTHRPVSDLERRHFRLLPAILDIKKTMVSPAVVRIRIHADSFVPHFERCKDVSVFCIAKL